MRSSPDSTLTIAAAVRGPDRSNRSSSSRDFAAAPAACWIASKVARTSTRVGSPSVGGMARRFEHRADGCRDVAEPVIRAAEGIPVGAGDPEHRTGDPGPPDADRPLVRLGERPACEEHGRDRERLGIERGEVLGKDCRLLGRLRRGGNPFGDLAPAAHAGDGSRGRPCATGFARGDTVSPMLHRRWFPDHIEGSLVVLRRHSRDNLRDFMRWYQDPEVARLTRYQDGPMRPEEIERFFTMRALGADSLAMGIEGQRGCRLISRLPRDFLQERQRARGARKARARFWIARLSILQHWIEIH